MKTEFTDDSYLDYEPETIQNAFDTAKNLSRTLEYFIEKLKSKIDEEQKDQLNSKGYFLALIDERVKKGVGEMETFLRWYKAVIINAGHRNLCDDFLNKASWNKIKGGEFNDWIASELPELDRDIQDVLVICRDGTSKDQLERGFEVFKEIATLVIEGIKIQKCITNSKDFDMSLFDPFR